MGHKTGGGGGGGGSTLPTSGGDTLTGTAGDDRIDGLAGNDTITGLGGDDTLAGNTGADTIDGGDGNDTIYSSVISPPYSFPYSAGAYTPPVLDTGTEVDTLKGGAGDDTIFAGYGDNVDGGMGSDTLFISFQGATSGIHFDLNLSSQVIGGGTISGIESVSWLQGSNYDDYVDLSGSIGYNSGVVFGMAGNDTIIAGYSTTFIDGGDGSDILDARGAPSLSEIDGGAGNDTIYTSSAAYAVVYGGDGADTITGGGQVHGGAGNDAISGNGEIHGDAGDDTIHVLNSDYTAQVTGDDGNDAIYGSDNGDHLDGGAGSDRIDAGAGDDTLIGGLGDDVLAGGSGKDQFYVGQGNDVITDFSAGDSLHIQAGFSAASISQVGNDVVVGLDGGGQVKLQNTDVATVDAALLSSIKLNDVAISADGSTIYGAGDDGNLYVYNAATGELVRAIHLGVELGGMDISPDGSFLVVTDLQPVSNYQDPWWDSQSAASVYKVDLSTGSVTTYTATLTGDQYAFYDAAILDNGQVLLTEQIFPGWSGWAPTSTLDLSTGQFTTGNDNLSVPAALTGHGSNVLIGEEDISDARLDIYSAASGISAVHQLYADNIYGFNSGVQAISPDGALVAQGLGSEINIYDGQLHYQFDLGQLDPQVAAGGVAGLAFDSAGQYLFVLNDQDNVIYQVSTSDWSVVGEYAVGADIESMSGGFGNRLLVAPDGSYFTVLTDDGKLVIVDPHAPALATEGNDTLLGTPGDDTIGGLGGDDIIKGLSGNDTLSGGLGDDIIAGGPGADVIDGGDGNDVLYSGDTIVPGYSYPPGSPVPHDTYALDRGTEVDTLAGGAGDDVIYAGYGDNVDGGAGNDTLYLSFQAATSGVSIDSNLQTQVVGGGTITGIETFAWIEGSNFDDYINTDSSSNSYGDYGSVYGMGGNDTIIAGAYTAWVDGGDGDDTLDGRASETTLYIFGGSGDDTILGSALYYSVAYGGDGNDSISVHGEANGDGGNDIISIIGDAGGDAEGGAGDDVITGGAGDDRLIGNGGADRIEGAAGDDFLVSGDFQSDYWAGVPDNGTDHDVLSGGDGNDHLFAGYGDDVDGGTGDDTLELSLGGATSGVTLDTADLTAGSAVTVGGGTIQDIEQLTYLRGSEFADDLTIAPQSSPITVDGGAGDDRIVSAADNARIDGGAGDDLISSTGVATFVDGGDGNDTITFGAAGGQAFGGDGNDTFVAGSGHNIFYGAAGNDTVSYEAATAGVTVALSANTTASGDELYDIENVTGSDFADKLTGNSGANIIDAGGGDDTINAGLGDDRLTGGGGNDMYLYGSGDGRDIISDFASGDAVKVSGYSSAQSLTQIGADVVVVFSSGNQITFENTTVAVVQAGLHFDVQPPMTLNGTAASDTLIGGSGSDTLNGLGGNDLLNGKAGADTMSGGTGNDVYYVDNSGDVVKELSSQGTDTVHTTINYTLGANVEKGIIDGTASINLTGNALANSLQGNSGDNFLYGMAGNDTLIGSAGNDTLRGGLGADTLTGGAGADIFQFEARNGNDRVTDFQSGVDKLDFRLLGITSTDIKTATSNGNLLIKVDVNHDGHADFTITLTGVTHVDASDYIFH